MVIAAYISVYVWYHKHEGAYLRKLLVVGEEAVGLGMGFLARPATSQTIHCLAVQCIDICTEQKFLL